MHHWQWHHQGAFPYLTCDLLAPWSHGFFTSRSWPHGPEDLVMALHGTASVHRVKQVHGNQVLTPSTIATLTAQGLPPELDRPPADGVRSEGADQALWVCSADCSPVLLAHRRTGQVAAVHAGWRGTAQAITLVAAKALLADGAPQDGPNLDLPPSDSPAPDPHDLLVAIGPAIDGAMYQVSITVAAEVGRTVAPGLIPQPNQEDVAVVQQFYELPAGPIRPDPQPGRARLDVRQVNALQLQQMGVPAANIAIAPHCTYQEPEWFFSYRRAKQKRVQWSGIVSQGRGA